MKKIYHVIIFGLLIGLYSLSWNAVVIYADEDQQNQPATTDINKPAATVLNPANAGVSDSDAISIIMPENEAASLNYEKDIVSLEILPLDVTLKVGQSWNFKVLAVYGDKSIEDISSFVSWQVSPDSSSIANNGLFQADESGVYSITASYGDQISKTAKVLVLEEARVNDKIDTVSRSAQASATAPKVTPKIPLRFGYPVDNYRMTLKFGDKNSSYGNKIHLGEDILLKEGTEIHSIADGIIVYYGAADGYGELVAIVEHNLDQDIKVGNKTTRRFASIYGHLRKYPGRVGTGKSRKLTGKALGWGVGKKISKGDVIGYVNEPPYNGMGGAHLHMGLRMLAAADNSRVWAYYGYENITKFPKSNINYFIPFSEAIMKLPK